MSRQLTGAAARAERGVVDSDATPPEPSDAPRVQDRGGQCSALEALYRHHAPWLIEALRRRFGREAADDLSQEAFVRVRLYAAAGGAIRRPRELLMTIASNAARELRRRAAIRAPEALQAGPAPTADLATAPAQFDAVLLKQVIAGLPPKLRVVFVLSRFEGLTYPEIAQRLGISIKTVEWRMSRALDLCAARLSD